MKMLISIFYYIIIKYEMRFSNVINSVKHKICLPGQPVERPLPVPSLAEGVMLMTTYEEFMIILTASLLIVAILNLKNK